MMVYTADGLRYPPTKDDYADIGIADATVSLCRRQAECVFYHTSMLRSVASKFWCRVSLNSTFARYYCTSKIGRPIFTPRDYSFKGPT
jgi:hypothetical protein